MPGAGRRDGPGAKVGIIAYGTTHWAIVESRDQLRARGRARDRLPPPARLSVHDAVGDFIDAHERVYVVEQNRDGQMLGLLRQELSAERIGKLRRVLHYNGLPIDARTLTTDILAQEGPQPRRPRR